MNYTATYRRFLNIAGVRYRVLGTRGDKLVIQPTRFERGSQYGLYLVPAS